MHDTHDGWLSGALGLGENETPFPWQRNLLRRFEAGEVPRALDIPTGLGKTGVMAIWLVARAMGFPVPRRLVYVVDRRAVVDQATTIAEKLRKFVEGTPELKKRLLLGDRSLPISTLRGKHVDNREWFEDPSAPAIIVGTVDMIGSRLLFNGYGVSRRMRPYHAGLLGVDTLFVLDEAHLVPPMERLLEAVAARDRHGLGAALDCAHLVPPMRLLSLSATGRHAEGALQLSSDDLADPIVRRRIGASKTLILRPPVAKGDLAIRLAEEAWGLAQGGESPRRLLVFCDTRDDANKVAETLRRHVGKARPEAPEIELFVGARRVYEREEAARWLTNHGFLAGGPAPTATTILVATSAAEVGIDLDADAAVMDVVAWERMVQRLGRINRRGDGAARVILVPIDGKDRQPEIREACLKLLRKLPRQGDGHDGSPGALLGLRERTKTEPALARLVADATTPAPLHPPLRRPLVDDWSMTSLDSHAGRPDVEPWLRGWIEEDAPQARVVFRDHLPLFRGRKLLDRRLMESFLAVAGPHPLEELETEVFRILDWLQARVRLLEGATEKEDATSDDLPLAIALSPRWEALLVTASMLRDKRNRERIERALAGGWLLVDSRLGGLRSGLLEAAGTPTSEEEVPLDLGRISGALPFRVRRVDTLDGGASEGYRVDASFVVETDREGEPTAWLLVESQQAQYLSETGRSISRRAQGLVEHQSWVEKEAIAIGERLGLPSTIVEALRIAARLHDEGKRAQRWQRAFRVPAEDRPLAKSTRAPVLKTLGAYRHELGSLPRMEADPSFASLAPEQRDLALHLVAAHHGRARPVLPTTDAEEPPTRLALRAQEVALRFSRLSKRFGPWGLAWLESLLRAADQIASRRNEESHG